jgi:DNA ligase-1
MAALRSEELNCELYIHGKYLQEIQSAVKKPNELSKDLTAGIFDIADSEHVYSQRRAFMANWKSSQLNPTVFAIIGTMCYSHEDIEICYNKAIAEGYEGTVIKNLDGLYQHNIRSSDQFKYKKAQSAEFMIVGFDLDKRNHPVFNLRSKASTVFSAKPKGTHEFLSSIDPETYVGKYATVEYETLSMAGTPLKPIFVSLRECNSLGEPTE